jgi:hypothetical protein
MRFHKLIHFPVGKKLEPVYTTGQGKRHRPMDIFCLLRNIEKISLYVNYEQLIGAEG